MQKKKRKTPKLKFDKKAVSPLVSTVLLIMIVIVLALIIIIWSGVFFKEALTKEIGGTEKTAEQRCSEIQIQTFINQDNTFGFKNSGNVPIYALNLKLTTPDTGSSDVIKIDSNDGGRVNPGLSTTLRDIDVYEGDGNNEFDYQKYEKVQIIPIILGKSKSGGNQQFTCPEINAIIV